MLKIAKQKTNKLLDWLSKRLGVDAHYIAKGGFWLGLNESSSSVFSFLLSIVFANLLPKETFGTYKYIISILGIISIFSIPGLNESFSQSVARSYEGGLKKIIKIQTMWSLFGSIISLGISGYYFFFQNNISISLSFLIIVIFFPFLEIPSIYNSLFLGRKDFKKIAQFSILAKTTNFIALIIVLLFFKNVFSLVLAFVLSYSVIRLVLLKIALKKYPPNQKEDSEVISYGKHLTIMKILGIISKQLDKILVFNFIGPVELAIYSLAVNPTNQIFNFINQIGSLIFPKLAIKTDKKKAKNNLRRKIIIISLITTFIVLIYIAIAPLFFKLLFPKFLEAAYYSQIFSLSLIASSAIIIPSTFLRAQKETKKLYWFNTVSPILNIFILIISIPFGLIGLIIGRVIFAFIRLIFVSFLMKKV